MVERIQDMNLPGAAVQKIIKDALPDGIGVGKDARIAISKAATVFVLYLTSTSSTVAKARNPKSKTLMPDNVLAALEEIDFENFVGPLRETLEAYRTAAKAKKTDSRAAGTNAENETIEPATE